MVALPTLLFLFCAGIALGCIFFGGLAVTLHWASRVRQPGLLILGSYFLRLAIVAGGIAWLSEMEWRRLTALLAGIVAARLLLLRFPPVSPPS